MEKDDAKIHFVGILGSGMYPLARLLLGRGYRVSGSDDAAQSDGYTDGYGIVITKPRAYVDASVIVYSLAVDEENPEIAYAKSRGIPLVSRAQLLGAMMQKSGVRIAVSGSHGKSTTTAIIDHVLRFSGLSHTTVTGAQLSDGDALYDVGGDVFLAEACEYKDSFLCLCPSHLIITSVELDHTDYFQNMGMIRASFLTAAKKADTVLLNADDPGCEAIRQALVGCGGGRRVYTYGKREGADYRFSVCTCFCGITSFSVAYKERVLELSTRLMGEFNLYNLTAATAMADIIGVGKEEIAGAIGSFTTIGRRLELISTASGIPIYYDYAHHPTEIGASVKALKERHGTLTVIFRPHTYSRTKGLWKDFISELGKADFTVLLDVYPAREKEIEGINARRLADEIPNCVYSRAEDAVSLALSRGTGAIVLMGAGEVEQIRREFIDFGKNTG